LIIYHPRNDLYHCIYRFINILNKVKLEKFEFIRLRIYDFYLLFPHFSKEIEFPRLKGVAALKNRASMIEAPYESLPDKKRLFSEMGDFHIQALQILVAKNILHENNGIISLAPSFYSSAIKSLLDESNNNDYEFFLELVSILNQVSVFGESGLKKRTGLMEYRYDAL